MFKLIFEYRNFDISVYKTIGLNIYTIIKIEKHNVFYKSLVIIHMNNYTEYKEISFLII